MTDRYINTATAVALLGVSASTLKVWRLGRQGTPPLLTEGVHWVPIGTRKILYNESLMLDFLATRHCPTAHERTILAFLEALPSSQSAKR
jgi:hypothetical protein